MGMIIAEVWHCEISTKKPMAKILVIDDEQDICEIVQFNLKKAGYACEVTYSAEDAWRRIQQGERYDLLLLDVMMGDMSGFDLAENLRNACGSGMVCEVPIIFMTALGSEDDIVRGLELGADDYMAKPISMREMVARVQAVLKRRRTSIALPQKSKVDIAYGELHLYNDLKHATLAGQTVSLTRMEYELLAYMLTHPNVVYSREQILANVWPDDGLVLERTVDVTMARLRKKIGPYREQLKAKVGYGYYFEA